MKLSQFKFKLPEERIALVPSENRDECRMMVLHKKSHTIEHKTFRDFIDYFDEKDLVLFNDTKIFPARLYGNKEKTGARIEVFLLRELNPDIRFWDVLVDPARKIRIGNKLYFGEDESLVAEVIDELDVAGKTVGIAPVGCSVMSYDFFGCDMIEAAHGRAPAVATACKRVYPDNVVFAYQGDGDLASIGMAETVHAATRGENLTIVFFNNAIYGMTGGQMAPTTLPNQVTQTSPYGRDVAYAGYPIRICELLSTLDGVAYLERVTLDTPAHVNKAKKAIKKGFQYQIEKRGYSLIEIVATCPTNWKMSPKDAIAWMQENMLRHYPLDVYGYY